MPKADKKKTTWVEMEAVLRLWRMREKDKITAYK